MEATLLGEDVLKPTVWGLEGRVGPVPLEEQKGRRLPGSSLVYALVPRRALGHTQAFASQLSEGILAHAGTRTLFLLLAANSREERKKKVYLSQSNPRAHSTGPRFLVGHVWLLSGVW